MKFPAQVDVPIRNQVTGRSYRLTRASALPTDDGMLGQIVKVCNEPERESATCVLWQYSNARALRHGACNPTACIATNRLLVNS